MATIVGMNDSDAHDVGNTVFHLYHKNNKNDFYSNILNEDKMDRSILALMNISLKDIKEVTCRIRPRVSKESNNPFLWGSEGKVFGIDINLIKDSGKTEVLSDIFLLKIFSDNVIKNHKDGLERHERTSFLCDPKTNLQSLANLSTADKLRFAGAPIFNFKHHIEHDKRKNNDEEYVCYIMKNAAVGISLENSTKNDRAIIRTWGAIRNEKPLSPRDRIAIACDLAGAVGLLNREGLQHCDISPENILVILPVRSESIPRLALIDFDCFYKKGRQIPTLPIHQEKILTVSMDDYKGLGKKQDELLLKSVKEKYNNISSDSKIESIGNNCYKVCDLGNPIRARNYLLRPGENKNCWDVWVLGAPGHEGYRAPIDILESEDNYKYYDYFSLGLMIFDILCWIDIDIDHPIISQKSINQLIHNKLKIPGKLHYMLHKNIRSLVERVFRGDPMVWPTPDEWLTALMNGPVYRICPGPKRSMKLWAKADQVCLWPLSKMCVGVKKEHPPSAGLSFLVNMKENEREALLNRGLDESGQCCPLCGSIIRWTQHNN